MYPIDDLDEDEPDEEITRVAAVAEELKEKLHKQVFAIRGEAMNRLEGCKVSDLVTIYVTVSALVHSLAVVFQHKTGDTREETSIRLIEELWNKINTTVGGLFEEYTGSNDAEWACQKEKNDAAPE